MRTQTLKTLLAVAALALGLAGPVAAQAPSVPRRPAPSTKKPAAGSVKITETEQAPADQTTAAAAPQTPAAAGTGMAPAAGGPMREEAGITSARDWLALVDAGQYPESYDQAGEIFRGALPRDQWANQLGNSRKQLGNLGQRNLKSAVVTQDLPNAPAGKYVVITFETSFQQQPQPQREIVTSYLNPNGQWKVVGYQVKPQDGAAGTQKPPQK